MSTNVRFEAVKKAVNERIWKRDQIRQSIATNEQTLARLKSLLLLKQQARSLLELFVKGTERRIKDYMEPLINTGLLFVFEQSSLFFHLAFSNRRNNLEIDFLILRLQTQEETYIKLCSELPKSEKKLDTFIKEHIDINDAFGGAVNQVLGVLLKFIVAELLKIEGPIFLDEPTSMVSEAYAGRLGNLIKSMSKKYNRQYIFITHSPSLASCADKNYTVDMQNGMSIISETIND